MPTLTLSDDALLKRRLAGDDCVTPENLEAYRELARAGIMIPISTFAHGPESRFQFTEEGWERRGEFIVPARLP